MNQLQILIRGGKTAVLSQLQAVLPIQHNLDRRSYRYVGAHGRIEGEQCIFSSSLERGVAFDPPIQNGAAILAFPELKVGRIFSCSKRISLRIYQIKTRRFTFHLAAK